MKTTYERLEEYHRLAKNDLVAAEIFLEQHSKDMRFVSLVRLEAEFMEAFKEVLEEETADKVVVKRTSSEANRATRGSESSI